MGGLSLQVCVVLAAAPVVAAADDNAGAIAAIVIVMLVIVSYGVCCGFCHARKRRRAPAARPAHSSGAVGRLRPGSGSGIGDYSWAARDKVARPGKAPASSSRFAWGESSAYR